MRETDLIISVQIREDVESWDEAAFLGEVRRSDLKTLIDTLEYWGIAGYEHCDISGQFVYHRGRIYFEVVIHTE